MASNSSSIRKAVKSWGAFFAVLLGLLVAVNYFVRVTSPSGRNVGIVIDWVGGMFQTDNFKNWETSAAYSSKAVDMLIRHGSNIVNDTEEIRRERARAIKYLHTALEATKAVEDDYLRASHPLLPEAYRNYEESLRLFLLGAETKDLKCFREAIPLYNGFLAFMKTHKDEFRPIK